MLRNIHEFRLDEEQHKKDIQEWSITKLVDMFDEDEIVVPEFQRREVWDNPKKSRLIESIIRDIPIPTIYLEQESSGKYIIIDGQQRILAIKQFIDDNLKLIGLKKLDELNNRRWSQLKGNKEIRTKIEEARLSITIISNCERNLKYEIFERLNTGAMQLNAQELRNCMFHGSYNKLIKDLALNEDFKYTLGSSLGNYHKRMRDVELVLRFFSFGDRKKLADYGSPMKRFLNRELEKSREISESQAKEKREKFEKSARLTRLIFGEQAFRKFNLGTESDPGGGWDKNKTLNKAIFDVVFCGFNLVPTEERTFLELEGVIKEELVYLMTEHEKFKESIGGGKGSTNDAHKVRVRFNVWLESLETLVKNKSHNTYSSKVKQELYEQNPDCSICGKKIQSIDDAVISGVRFYWRSEKIPPNTLISHRYCETMKRRS